ncbi:type 1 glutamine amidotransferase domain-containing protein [Pseudoalteromonas sp. SR43-3]|uniref:type 1 glutamine amidotransferase domain-containing protein n=1 Tax=Pseudoalteromonas sp. SR43-3 TaxID=2760943 RepID=UPI001C722703|nr:type 1 glutamine amidotransferase domain-containing protein [Pseudoalteromonas sp. SR43-3]
MKFLLLFMTLVFAAPSFAADKILFVLTSHNKMGSLDMKTGFWLGELTHPYYVLADAGFEVDVASIDGGMAPIDPKSLDFSDENNARFINDKKLMASIINTKAIEDVNSEDYQAVVYVGGHGTMWDFSNNERINKLTVSIYERGGIVSAICHGPAALTDVKLSNGQYLVKGKKLAVFTNEEESNVGLTEVVPFSLQDTLMSKGAKHIYGAPWTVNVVNDRRVITGQNPQSARKVGEEILTGLKGIK